MQPAAQALLRFTTMVVRDTVFLAGKKRPLAGPGSFLGSSLPDFQK
jgi:hypothetical protein